MAAPATDTPPVEHTTTWRGLFIVIENLAGSYREWTDRDGKTGRTAMQWPYGYFADHLGADGDELDCYIGPQPEAPFVYVVHQLATPDYVKFDEDKCFLGFASEQAAKAVFMQHRSDGDRAYGGMSVIPAERFIAKLKSRSGSGKIRHSRGATTMPVRTFHGISGTDLRGYAGRVHAFDALDGAGKVRVGVWDRFATFGEGAEGIKVKEGEAVAFTPETFAKMVDNWAARGQQLTMCLDHRSALGGVVEAPAAALYDAIAVVGEDGRTLHMKTVYGKTIPEPDAQQLLEQCSKYPPPLSQPGGMWGFRSEITPKGQHPTEGLANFRGISPLFVMNGVDEQERPIGPVLFDVAAVNVNFQGGCELTLGALTSLVRMSAAESALHVPGPVEEKKPVEMDSGGRNQSPSLAPGDRVRINQLPFYGVAAIVKSRAPDGMRWRLEMTDGAQRGATVDYLPTEIEKMSAPVSMAWSINGIEVGDTVRVDNGDGDVSTCKVIFKDANGIGVKDLQTGRSGYLMPRDNPRATVTKMSAETAPGVTAMASVSDLNVGDRVRNAKTGNAGTITEKKADGSAHVKWEGADGDGWFYPGAPLPLEISKMSAAPSGKGAVKMALPGEKVTCPDCGQRIPVARTHMISIHDKPGGSRCPGSDRGADDMPAAMSATPGAARRFNQGAGMDPSMMAKFGVSAESTLDEKMSKYAAACMGDATPDEIKAMAADLEASGDDKAKAMAKKMGDLVLTHKDDDGPTEPALPAAMAAQFSALSAANGALAAQLAELKADKEARDAAARAEQEKKFSALADAACAGGYPKEEREALIAFARSNFGAAEKLAKPFLADASPVLFTRTQTGATGPASTPGVKRTGNVVRYGMDLSAAIKRIQTEEKVSFERAAHLAGERHPEMLTNYEAHQGN